MYGKTSGSLLYPNARRNRPRVCRAPLGSSTNVCCKRITLAHAGKTFRVGSNIGGVPDHPRSCGENASLNQVLRINAGSPRACGENFNAVSFYDYKKGSPPRMRGKPAVQLMRIDDAGITPARAGKTCYSVSQNMATKDHPRACGENLYVFFMGNQCGGSPPRVRGKQSASIRWVF